MDFFHVSCGLKWYFFKTKLHSAEEDRHIYKEVKLRPVIGIKYAAKPSVVPHPHNKDDLFP